MHYFSSDRVKISLRPLKLQEAQMGASVARAFSVSGAEDSGRLTNLVNRAARTIFEMGAGPAAVGHGGRRLRRGARRSRAAPKMPMAFKDQDDVLRVVYKEIMIRFATKTSVATRKKILAKHGFAIRKRNAFCRRQYVVKHKSDRRQGAQLLDVANDWADMEEVEFSIPNFVSEYQRVAASPKIHSEQWHLTGSADNVDIRKAWRITQGKPSIAVAVLDDGVEIKHPDLKRRIKKDADGHPGRDFFVPDDSPEHHDPNPKVFNWPYDELAGNDIHGTPCAGVICASGASKNVRGAAPRCKVLPVKIFHADAIAPDEYIANAIRYSAANADILSCSWSGPYSPDVESAITEDAGDARGGKGAAVFCAAGNESSSVGYPARLPAAVAVGASTHKAKLAHYSNTGPEISVVAPSSGDGRGIYCSDVAIANRGFNLGSADAGGADGVHTNDFGGTSSATPLAAGVAALMLSVKPSLTREEVREILQETADKIDGGYGSDGHSNRYGYGRVNAGEAVKAAKNA